jgi:murein L,D-transpeptidase YcbB/YkuD
MRPSSRIVAPLISAAFLAAYSGMELTTADAQATPSETAAPAADAAAPSPAPNSPPSAAPPSTTLDPSPGVPAPAADAPASTSPAATPAATPEAPPPPASPPEQAATPPSAPAATSTTPAATPPAPPAAPAPAADQAATPPAADPAAPAPAPQAQAPTAPADPVVAAVRDVLADKTTGAKAAPSDRDAVAAFYQARSEGPLWVKPDGTFSPAAQAIAAEIKKADEWGLQASAFSLPQAGSDTSPPALAKTEAAIALVALQYAREARGGRINPQALSPGLDLTPPLKDPSAVLADLAKTDKPDAYLRDLHPKHEQFVRLREALLKVRAPASTTPPPEDEALSIKLPPGKVIKPGQQHDDVSLLRRRLKVPAEAGNENIYDEPLQEAVLAFQRASGIKANAFIGKATRAALNGDETSKPDPDRDVQRIVNNMERWRWMPEQLGDFYIWNNIPEYKTRAMKAGKQVYDERIVVGLPQWATPSFSAQMKTIVFHPEWGVPDGIKQKELAPQLRRSSGGGMGIFEDLFGGGGGGSSSAVLRRHDLRVSYNGRQVDPDSVDWNSVDIRRFQFTQPSGPKNVLGIVKFLFPNKHDVYMHDTTAKDLFSRNMRAYSHGCMRLQNPIQFAELLLQEDKGWAPGQVRERFNAGGLNELKIDKPIWVHTTYFTATVDDSGKLHTFADVYGYEPRVAAALTGKQYRFEAPPEIAEVDPDAPPTQQQRRRKQRVTQTDPLTEAISGLFAN